MKIKLLVVVIVTISLSHFDCMAQSPGHKFIYSTGNFGATGFKMKKLLNNDYLIVQCGGYSAYQNTFASGYSQMLRYDSTGAMKYYKQSFPSGVDQYINLNDVVETNNDELVYVGFIRDSAVNIQFLIFKTDSSGNLIWAKLLKLPAGLSIHMEAGNVFINSSNNIVVVGSYLALYAPYTAGTYFLEISQAGNKIYEHFIEGDIANSRYRGFTEPNGDIVMPFNKCGILVADSAFNKKNYFSAQLNNVQYTSIEKIIRGYNNDYIIVLGISHLNPVTYFDPALACFDSAGQFKWLHKYAIGNSNVWPFDIMPVGEQSYIISAEGTDSLPAFLENFLLRVDADGNLLNAYKSPYHGTFYFMEKQAANKYFMTGQYQNITVSSGTYSPMCFVITDSLMQNLCLVPHNSFSDTLVTPNAFNTGLCSDQIPAGMNLDNALLVIDTIEYNEVIVCNTNYVIETSAEELFSVFPNPVSTKLTVTPGAGMHDVYISVSEVSGRQVYNKFFDTINASLQIDISFLHDGFYFLILRNNNTTITKKFIKQ